MTTLALTGENEEQNLVLRATAGDADAFGELYGRYSTRVYRHIYFMVCDNHVADDLTSETFLKAWQAVGCCRDRHAFAGWLLRIAHNVTISHMRKRDNDRLDDDIMEEKQNHNPEAVILQLEDEQLVRDAVGKLPSDKRKLVRLRFYEDKDYEEAATALGMTVPVTRVLQFRTLADLRKLLA